MSQQQRSHPASEAPEKAATESYLTRDFLLFFLSAISFVLSNVTVNPSLPLYVVQMGGTQGQVGVVLAFRTITALITRPLAGMLVDKGHAGKLLVFAGLNGAICSVSYAYVPMVWLVGAIEVFKGMSNTAITSAGSTAVANLAPPRRRGEALGLYGMASPVAVVFGPAVGMLLLARAGFTSLFFLGALLGLISMVLAAQIRIPQRERSATSSLKLFNRDALLPSGALICTTVASAPLWAFIPLYTTQNSLGDPSLFFIVYAISMSLVRLAAGRLSDTHGRVRVFVPGALVLALSSILLSTNPNYLSLLVAGVLLGVGEGASQSALMTLAIDRAKLTERGSAVSTSWAAFDAGLTLGVLADGFILEWSGFGAMFAANAVMPVIGVIGFLLLDRRSRRQALITE